MSQVAKLFTQGRSQASRHLRHPQAARHIAHARLDEARQALVALDRALGHPSHRAGGEGGA